MLKSHRVKTTACTRCNGTGQYHVHGACYQCGGSGRMKAAPSRSLVRSLRTNRDMLISAVRAAKNAGTGDPANMADTVKRARRINRSLVQFLRSKP